MGKSSKYKGLKCAYAAIKLAYMTINWTEYLSAFVIANALVILCVCTVLSELNLLVTTIRVSTKISCLFLRSYSSLQLIHKGFLSITSESMSKKY